MELNFLASTYPSKAVIPCLVNYNLFLWNMIMTSGKGKIGTGINEILKSILFHANIPNRKEIGT